MRLFCGDPRYVHHRAGDSNVCLWPDSRCRGCDFGLLLALFEDIGNPAFNLRCCRQCCRLHHLPGGQIITTMKDETTMELEKHVIELTRRVMALEAWKAEMLNHTINVMMTPPSKAERDQPREYYLPKGVGFLPTTDSQPIGYDQRPLDRQPEIDWGKVRSSSIQALCTPDNPFAHCKAAVAEYLRQVKELDHAKHEVNKQAFFISTNPMVLNWDRVNAALAELANCPLRSAAQAALNDWWYQEKVKEGGK